MRADIAPSMCLPSRKLQLRAGVTQSFLTLCGHPGGTYIISGWNYISTTKVSNCMCQTKTCIVTYLLPAGFLKLGNHYVITLSQTKAKDTQKEIVKHFHYYFFTFPHISNSSCSWPLFLPLIIRCRRYFIFTSI